MLKIFRLSTSVTSSISTTPFFRRLSDSLSAPHRAVVKLNLLRLARVVCDNHPDRETLVSRFDLARIVDRLAKQDDAILVRELAKEIYPSLLFGNDPPEYHVDTGSGGKMGNVPKRVLSTMRRTTSENTSIAALNEGNAGGVGRGVAGGGDAIREKDMDTSKVTMAPVRGDGGDPRHKRKISRSHLR